MIQVNQFAGSLVFYLTKQDNMGKLKDGYGILNNNLVFPHIMN